MSMWIRYIVLNTVIILAALNGVHGQTLSGGQPQPWQIGFQKPATPVMTAIQDMHTWLLWVMTLIGISVFLGIIGIAWRFHHKRHPHASGPSHHVILEVIWTAIPTVIVCVIAVCSIRILYFMDKTTDPELTIKVTGKQWYWTYDYPDHDLGFDSIMLEDHQLKPGQLRLLEVDHRLVVPAQTNIRILVTAADVIHSWAIPSLGVKKDGIPGRLNETWIRVQEPGVYYGQCSELCGARHAFMPIAVEVIPKETFIDWLASAKKTFAALPTKLYPSLTWIKTP